MLLGKVNVARVNPYRSCQGEPPMHLACLAPYRPVAVTQSGGDSRSSSYPVDDVPQARMTYDVVGGGG